VGKAGEPTPRANFTHGIKNTVGEETLRVRKSREEVEVLRESAEWAGLAHGLL